MEISNAVEYGYRMRFIKDVAKETLSHLNPKAARSLLFFLRHRRLLHFWNPRDFSEKMNWRILHDRRSDISWMGDKMQMKVLARQRSSGVLIPETLWFGRELHAIVSTDIPEGRHWVLKPNQSSGQVHFGQGPIGSHDLQEILKLVSRWGTNDQFGYLHEWAYSSAEQGFLLEERLGDKELSDFKFFVFNGTVQLVAVDEGRYTAHRRTFLNRDAEMMDFTVKYQSNPNLVVPLNFMAMVEIAEQLSANVDFVRIDLYSYQNEVYFGEFSPYAHSGLEKFSDRKWDSWLGAFWKLPEL